MSGVCCYMFNQMDNITIKYYLRITLHHLDVIAGKFVAMGLDEWAAQPVITVKPKCTMFLWNLANNNTFWELSDKFNISKSWAHKTIEKCLNLALYNCNGSH